MNSVNDPMVWIPPLRTMQDAYQQTLPELQGFMRPGSATLFYGIGDVDLSALGLHLAATHNCPLYTYLLTFRKVEPVPPVYYYYSSSIPEYDKFLSKLTQLEKIGLRPSYQYAPWNFCTFPQTLFRHVPYLFRWIVLERWVIPWRKNLSTFHHFVPTNANLFNNVTLPYVIFPEWRSLWEACHSLESMPILFIDNFDTTQYTQDFLDLLKQFKKNMWTLIVFEHSNRKLCRNGIWDNLIYCQKRKNYRCSNRDIIVTVKRSIYKTTSSYYYLKSEDKTIFWTLRQPKHEQLKLIIAECVKQRMTARETVGYLLQKWGIQLSLTNLARLKRKWGLRTYRPEKKPRAPKKTKKQSPYNL